jgi:hypothetical protein
MSGAMVSASLVVSHFRRSRRECPRASRCRRAGWCGRREVSAATRVCALGHNPLWCTAINVSGGCGTAACISDGRRAATVRTRREKRTYSLVAKDCVVVRQNLTKPDPLQPLHRSAVVTTRIWCRPHTTVSTLLTSHPNASPRTAPCAERLH